MGRTAGQFCSRDSMLWSPSEANMSNSPSPTNVAERTLDTAMTWQQKMNFGPAVKANERKSKSVRWQPLDLTAIKDPPVASTTGNGDSWSEQLVKVPIVNPRRQPRGKAAPNPPSTLEPPPSIDSPLPNTPHHDKSPLKPLHKRSHRRNKKHKDMAPLPERAYVPPHLRSCAAAPTATNGAKPTASATAVNEEKAVPSAINGSDSSNNKQGNTDKLHLSSNRLSHASSLTTYLPTPPPELKPRDVKAPTLEPPHVAEEVDKSIKSGRVVEPPEDGNVNGDQWSGWDTPKPDAPAVAPKTGNPRWPRIRGPPPRKNVWPKQRDMKPRPSESESDGGISCKSNSNGDPTYDVKKLVDWNGDWLPPPEEWSARKGHSSRHFGQGIERWIDGHAKDCLTVMEVTTLPSFIDERACREVVPKYWIASRVEQGSLAKFWKLMPTRQPTALSDVSTHRPFWERYGEEPIGCFIEGLAIPDAKVDMNDPENNFGGADLLASATDRIECIMERRHKSHRKALAKQKRPAHDSVPVEPRPQVQRFKPLSNVYFRPVIPADIEGITEIYNKYVETSIFANEFDARTVEQIRNRVDVIVKAGLPYLVAVARGDQSTGHVGFVSEKIVGFASLDDYCDQSSMYRYTFELELYVHPDFVRQHIAKCLLDRLLELANTGYNARGGYVYRNDSQYLKCGPSRVIKTIMLTVQKEHGESDDNTAEWLKQFKFSRAGHIPYMGYKLDKVVDVFLYRHTTSETIESGGRPSVPLER